MKENIKQIYIPINENGNYVKFKSTKDGFVIPLGSINSGKEGHHLTIYFKHFKEVKEENPEELYYLNLHIKDESNNIKLFEEEFYFNLTKIQNIFKYNFDEFLKILRKHFILEKELENKIFSIEAYLDSIKFQERFKLLTKKKTCYDFFENLDNRNLNEVLELERFPYSKFRNEKEYYCFENNRIYRRLVLGKEIYFIDIYESSNLQEEVLQFIMSLFPNFKKNIQKFANVIDVQFPGIIDLEKINNLK